MASFPSVRLSMITAAVLAAACPAMAQTAGEPAAQPDPQQLPAQLIIGTSLGKGEARANTVIDQRAIQEQPQGLDPLKLLSRVPGLQVGSGDAVGGSFSTRLSMRGMTKEQIGLSIDGIPNGSTLSNGGSMPIRLLDPSNLSRVNVSQTAGEIGTPSNQALGGFIDFQTRDPARVRGVDVELSAGNYGYRRAFARFDTGEVAQGLTAYVDAAHDYIRTWPGDQSGRSSRDHFDLRVLQQFDGGSSLRATVSYNDMSSNDYDAVALSARSTGYKSNFETSPQSDGLTDLWTGDPAKDQNYRRTRGIDSKELFAHVDGTLKLGELTTLSLKPYYHHQEGNGWFYVPYKQLPANGQLYSAVGATDKAPVATVQECFANQYQRNPDGSLVKLPAVTFPIGVTAATLKAAGCPAAAAYAMNDQSAWGAREASTRRGGYETDRTGTLAEASTVLADLHTLRVGGWYEHIDRTKTRNWYQATDPTRGGDYAESSLYSITQDRNYRSHSSMVYAQDRMSLLDDRMELDLGLTYQSFTETYRSPVEFYGTRELSVNSKLLPKLAALYRIGRDWEVFASGSKNFSAIPDSVFEGTAAVDSKNGIQPETSVNKDLGVRWLGRSAGLTLQLYDIDYRDRISIQNGNPNGDIFSRDATTTFRNQGGISSRGFDVTGRALFGPVELYANYEYNDAHYTEDTPAENIRGGDPVLGVARHSAFAEASWRTDLWRAAVNVKYVGEAAGSFDVRDTSGNVTYPREHMPAYTLVGLSAGYRLPDDLFGAISKAELTFNVDNLFNEHYLGGLGQELTTSSPLTSGRYFLGSPRTFFVGLKMHL